MKRKSIFLLIIISITLLVGYRFIKASRFICPIKYKGDIVVRCDGRGEGFFAAGRSGGRLHNGLDLYAKVGTPVLASRYARVLKAGQNRGMGKFVVLRHWGGYTTVYGHLDKVYVKRHQRVMQGQVIGTVGKTGNARYSNIEPHLHFELKKNGKPQDPLKSIEEVKFGNKQVVTSN